MKKLLFAIVVLSTIISCEERMDEQNIEKNEKTKTIKKVSTNRETFKQESDSTRAITVPANEFDPGATIDPPGDDDPGEVGPVKTIPPK